MGHFRFFLPCFIIVQDKLKCDSNTSNEYVYVTAISILQEKNIMCRD